MMKPSINLALFLALGAIIGALSCTWTEADSKEFYGMLIIGTVLGALFTIGSIVFACLPLCGGLMKEKGKIIAGIVIFIGLFSCFIPAITGMAQGSAAVDKMCDRCGGTSSCTEDDRTKAKEAISALGVIVAYISAYGFVVVILGIVATSLGCAICCKCCKMKDEVGAAGGQPAVIGQPA